MMRSQRTSAWTMVAVLGMVAQVSAETPQAAVTIFDNVRVFDSRRAIVTRPSHVLVRGNLIERVSSDPIPAEPGATVIAGGGRVLMPGLINAHTHVAMAGIPQLAALTADLGFVTIVAAKTAESLLMQGFTTVRDLGGPVFGLKQAIDTGLVPGPRIFPSGAFVSQTGGHGDFRMPNEVPREPGAPLTFLERAGLTAIADSPDEVRLRVREQLRQGATQVKLMAGGGVSSVYDPIDVAQFSEAEFRAAVEAAENWGTYVTVHAYTPRAIQMAIAAGVKCIDHGQLLDEATAKLMADRGVWLSLQPFLDDEDASPQTGVNRVKQQQVMAGTDTAFTLAKKHGIKVAFGTDTLFSATSVAREGAKLAKLTRWFTAAEALRVATAYNADLLALSGERHPYPGRLGVVEEGALADLILVDGNPADDLGLVADPARNFLVIMKDGRIYKNRIAP